MSIEKLPKKLRVFFDEIRNGVVENCITNLDSIEGFDAQKGIVLAEIFYYQSDYNSAMDYDERSLLHNDKWYAGNILTEHFYAYTYAAIESDQVERAIKFYNFFLEVKEQLDLPEHLVSQYRYLTEQHILKLKGYKKLYIDQPPINLITEGKAKREFEDQLRKYRPKLDPDSIEGIEYILQFMITDCATSDVFECYEKYADKIKIENIHVDIARLYVISGRLELAWKTLIRYAERSWWPVEHLQVLPMRVFEYGELLPILNNEFKMEILNLPKVKLTK
ncbi:hypothetical protein ACTJJ0_12260 [Chitinophaga sp. 22321]|uniref:Uncharacterized protein n=1 Tax=Chitinophaga hostae TaxID=2831022 RepID=A0ABS5IWR6_9BACT|nr:hypothetical protein [Chitinophaga hostae]MBS0027231.1 hypothetical protein [Chitinophaga hostae]